MGLAIPLEIHHINGNHKDNHLENLQILCPTCHALTNNYRGKNIDAIKIKQNKEDVKVTIEKLKEREKTRKEEILQNHIKNGDISKNIRGKKEKRYCQICGKEILGRGEKYCSYECANKANRKTEYDSKILLEQSKTVRSLSQLAKLYNLTDNALKKHLIKLGIYEECRNNFLPITKIILQYDLDGNFIKE